MDAIPCLGVLILVIVVLFVANRFELTTGPPYADRLRREGHVAEGDVLGLEAAEGARASDVFGVLATFIGVFSAPGLTDDESFSRVIYRFHAEHEGVRKDFQGSMVLADDDNPAMLVGRTVRVRYLAEDPRISMIEVDDLK